MYSAIKTIIKNLFHPSFTNPLPDLPHSAEPSLGYSGSCIIILSSILTDENSEA